MQKTRFDKAEKKIAWLLDGAHKLVKKIELDWRNRSPMSGRWQIPQNVVTAEPTIKEKDGYDRIYENGKWAYIDKDGNRIIFEKSSTNDSRIDDTAPANVSWLVIGLS